MHNDGEFSSLIRLKKRSLVHGINNAENLANFLNLGSKENCFEISKINFSAAQFLSKYDELLNAEICGTLGNLPREHQGFRSDVADQQPIVLDSFFGSISSSSSFARNALLDTRFVDRITRRLTSRVLETLHRPAYYNSSPAAAICKGSDAAACVSQALSLWIGVNVSLEAQFISGSDANNFLSCLGMVAIGDDSFGAGRGQLRELTSRSFLLEYVKNGKPTITDKEREMRVWKLPYGNYYEELQQWRETRGLLDIEVESIKKIESKIETAKKMGITIKVFLAELVTADTMLCLRGQFLYKLSQILEKHGITFAVDDIMAGIRCGQSLSIQLYGTPENWPVVPRFVTLGKLYGTALLLSLDSGRSPDRLIWSRGMVTNQFDEMQLCRLQEFIRVTSQHEVLQHVRTMPEIIVAHFQEFLSIQEGSFVSGVGAMLYTNIEMDPSQVDPALIQFNRILPPLNASVRDFQALVPLGVNREVVKDVSPDNIRKLQLLSEIWPKIASKRKVSEARGARHERRSSSPRLPVSRKASRSKRPARLVSPAPTRARTCPSDVRT